jgi:hypothetical protein
VRGTTPNYHGLASKRILTQRACHVLWLDVVYYVQSKLGLLQRRDCTRAEERVLQRKHHSGRHHATPNVLAATKWRYPPSK